MSATYLMVTFDPEKKTILAPAFMETFSESELPVATGRAFLINEMNRHTGFGEPVGVVPLVAPGTMQLGVDEIDNLATTLERHNRAMARYLSREADPALAHRAQEALAQEFSPDILAELVRHYAAHQVRA